MDDDDDEEEDADDDESSRGPRSVWWCLCREFVLAEEEELEEELKLEAVVLAAVSLRRVYVGRW